MMREIAKSSGPYDYGMMMTDLNKKVGSVYGLPHGIIETKWLSTRAKPTILFLYDADKFPSITSGVWKYDKWTFLQEKFSSVRYGTPRRPMHWTVVSDYLSSTEVDGSVIYITSHDWYSRPTVTSTVLYGSHVIDRYLLTHSRHFTIFEDAMSRTHLSLVQPRQRRK